MIHPEAKRGYSTAVSRPTRGTRTPFTAEDDRILEEWVLECQRRNSKILGNEIYLELAERVSLITKEMRYRHLLTIIRQNSRHSYQSWRDRWIKYVSKTSRAVRPTQPAPMTPPSDASRIRSGGENGQGSRRRSTPVADADFSKDDFQDLLLHGDDIADIATDQEDHAWEKWAQLKRVSTSSLSARWQD